MHNVLQTNPGGNFGFPNREAIGSQHLVLTQKCPWHTQEIGDVRHLSNH